MLDRLRAVASVLSNEAGGGPCELFWWSETMALLSSLVGHHDDALGQMLRADDLADETGLLPLRRLAALDLSYLFLSVGDLEGARTTLRRDVIQHWPDPPAAIGVNLLLCLVLDGQGREADQWLHDHPEMLVSAQQAGPSSLRTVLALLALNQRRMDVAARWLGDPSAWQRPSGQAGDTVVEPSAVLGNLAWVRASVVLAGGDAASARELCEQFLADAQHHGWPVSPMNQTQLYRVLSEANESLGDLRAALQALRRSQAACFHWVAQSMSARLRVLHRDTRVKNQSEVQQQRLDRVRTVAAQAEAPAPDPAGPQRQFLAHVTHEMRNPLNGVLGMTSLLMLSDLDERQRRYLTIAQSSAQMLLALCNDLLDLAKLDAGRFELNPRLHDPRALAEEVVEVHRLQAQSKGVQMVLTTHPDLPAELCLDGLRLRQVLMNLVGNATKFTKSGRIEVHVTWQAGRLRMDVVDTGPGINAQVRARLFQEYSQADAGVAERHGGTGLGLALCRKLLALMGGTIDAASEPGRGSRFWFEFPAPLTEPEPSAIASRVA